MRHSNHQIGPIVIHLGIPLRRLVGSAGAALLLTALLNAPASAVTPSAVSCGATLTQNTTLTADLTCAGNGLTLAPGVTLDLGSHRLTGNGTGTAVAMPAATEQGNKVTNGRITGWARGVNFAGADGFSTVATLTLSRLSVVNAPVSLETGTVTVRTSAFRNSPVQAHVTLLTADRSGFVHSTIDGEMNFIVLTAVNVVGGGVAQDENNQVRILNSTMEGAGFTGVPLQCSVSAEIVGSRISHYLYPVYGGGDCPLRVISSTFSDNPNGAVVAGGRPDAPPTEIIGNTFLRNGPAVRGTFLTITGNTFTGNATAVDLSEASGSSVLGNVFTANQGSGIYTNAPYLVVGANRATGNGGYGIYAPKALDYGGNQASGNQLGQCVGVACAP